MKTASESILNIGRTINTPITKEELGKQIPLRPTDYLTISSETEGEFTLKITDTRGSGNYPSTEARYKFAQRFPERREVPGSLGTHWKVPVTDISAQLIQTLWPIEQRKFEDEETERLFKATVSEIVDQVAAMERSAEYHEYIKWRNCLATGSGMELDYEYHDQMCGPANTDPAEVVGRCGYGKGFGMDRLFLTEEGMMILRHPTDAAPLMPLGGGHFGMLHQTVGVQNAMGRSYGFFFEPGTGKTASAIHLIDLEAEALYTKEGRAYRALIVVPNNIALNWENEFKEFSTVAGTVTVLRGLTIDRIKLLIETLQNPTDNKYIAVICSYEIMCNMWDYLGAVQWDRSFLDEAHYIKWPMTKRSKFAMKLRDKSNARTPLTGTPVCNTPIDLYALFEYMQKGGSGFSTFKAFQNFYGVFEQRWGGSRRMVDVQNLPFLKERIARLAMIVSRAEALPDLPEIQRDVLEVEMSPEQWKIYRDVMTKLFAEIENDIREAGQGNRRTVNADNILTKLLRLAQITSGFVAYDAVNDPETGDVVCPKGIDRIDPNPKIETMMTLFKDEDGNLIKGPDQKTIIWACWKQDIKTIAARLAFEGIDCVQFYGETDIKKRQEAEYRFNYDPKCKVFIGNPGCGGVGLNLIGYPPRKTNYTTNCDHVIYFSQDWSHPKRVQSEMRANRLGTRVVTRCTDLCVRRTIDEEIRARVLNKRTMALKTQDLAEVLGKVLGMKAELS
jgi:hypothetical protein